MSVKTCMTVIKLESAVFAITPHHLMSGEAVPLFAVTATEPHLFKWLSDFADVFLNKHKEFLSTEDMVEHVINLEAD